MASTPGESAARAFPYPLKLLRRYAVIGWSGWLVCIGLLWGQHELRVLHPWSLPFLLLLAVIVLAAPVAIVCAVWQGVRGPRRLGALASGCVALLPIGLWAALGAYILHLQASHSTPKNTLTNIASVAIASLMELQAEYTYPYRMESQRLVMFYDDRVTDRQRDLEAMDGHVAQLETMTGSPLRAKIYWVRGELFGQRRMAICGLALGSSRSPADWETADHPDRLSEDRHELAHAVIHQLQPADADAPTVLIEGWAEAHAGMTSQKRAEWAQQSRTLWRERTEAGLTESYLRDLTGPAWYHRIDGPVYSVGGVRCRQVWRRALPALVFCLPARSFRGGVPGASGREFGCLGGKVLGRSRSLGRQPRTGQVGE